MAALLRTLKFRPNLTVTEYVDFVMPLLYSKKWRVQHYVDENGIKTNVILVDYYYVANLIY
jgi:hypothetical protein